jgi:putative flippase GtrA
MAFGISFTGNFYWTYKALKRFFFISIIAFIVNSLVLMKLLSTSSLGAEIAIVAAAGIIPVITFIVSKLWIYKDYENAK